MFAFETVTDYILGCRWDSSRLFSREDRAAAPQQIGDTLSHVVFKIVVFIIWISFVR